MFKLANLSSFPISEGTFECQKVRLYQNLVPSSGQLAEEQRLIANLAICQIKHLAATKHCATIPIQMLAEILDVDSKLKFRKLKLYKIQPDEKKEKNSNGNAEKKPKLKYK